MWTIFFYFGVSCLLFCNHSRLVHFSFFVPLTYSWEEHYWKCPTCDTLSQSVKLFTTLSSVDIGVSLCCGCEQSVNIDFIPSAVMLCVRACILLWFFVDRCYSQIFRDCSGLKIENSPLLWCISSCRDESCYFRDLPIPLTARNTSFLFWRHGRKKSEFIRKPWISLFIIITCLRWSQGTNESQCLLLFVSDIIEIAFLLSCLNLVVLDVFETAHWAENSTHPHPANLCLESDGK